MANQNLITGEKRIFGGDDQIFVEQARVQKNCCNCEFWNSVKSLPVGKKIFTVKIDNIINEVFSFPFKNKYNESIKQNAKSGSVNPEKIITIFNGAVHKKTTLKNVLSFMNNFAVRYVNTIVNAVISELNILIPAKPNCENGELNKT